MLPGLERKAGVPQSLRTIVVVPTLLTNEQDLIDAKRKEYKVDFEYRKIDIVIYSSQSFTNIDYYDNSGIIENTEIPVGFEVIIEHENNYKNAFIKRGLHNFHTLLGIGQICRMGPGCLSRGYFLRPLGKLNYRTSHKNTIIRSFLQFSVSMKKRYYFV